MADKTLVMIALDGRAEIQVPVLTARLPEALEAFRVALAAAGPPDEYPKWVHPEGQPSLIVSDTDEEAAALGLPKPVAPTEPNPTASGDPA